MAKENKRDNSDSRIASLKMQNKEYNEMFRKWRIEHKNDYGFFFLDNSDELTYRDGEGFITQSPEAAERVAVREIHTLIANFLTIYTILNIIIWAISKTIPMFFERISVFYDNVGFYTGNETGALAVTFLINVGKRLLPLFYILRKIRMPLKMMLPTKIYNKPLFHAAVPVAMLTFGVCTMFSGLVYTELALCGLDPAVRIWVPGNRYCFVMSVLISVVIIPVISEIIHRGILMQILKQFGDGYALVATSVITALTTGNYRTFMFTFIISVVIGYFFLRSGSILTAFVMRITINGLTYFLNYMKYVNLPKGSYISLSLLLTLICLTVGIIGTGRFVLRHSNKINLPVYGMYMTDTDRLMTCLSTPAVIIWLALTFVFMIVGVDVI